MHGTSPVPLELFGGLAPVRRDYVVAPIEQAFNWSECLASVEHGQWYVVAFRSVRRFDSDDALLDELDERAFAEASDHAGLLHYFKGEMDDDRRCLSMCIWEDRNRARQGASLPQHTAAIAIARATYTSYVLERYRLTKSDGELELLELEPPQRSEAVGDLPA